MDKQTYSVWVAFFDLQGTLQERQKTLDRMLYLAGRAKVPISELLDITGCSVPKDPQQLNGLVNYLTKRIRHLGAEPKIYALRHYLRHGLVSIGEYMDIQATLEEDRKKGGNPANHMNLQGVMCGIAGTRIETYYHKGTDCVNCGLEGKYFAIEKDMHQSSTGSNWHLNLYARHEDGHEVLMTRDHIVPASKNGKATIANSQPMCQPCNTAKGNKFELDIKL